MNLPLDILPWEGASYNPIFESKTWMVALMNFDPIWKLENCHEIERHTLTDEVFVLLKGKAAFYMLGDDGLTVVEIAPHVVYNVHVGGWHNLIATEDAKFLIVENIGTNHFDTERRKLTSEEKQQLLAKAPSWAI